MKSVLQATDIYSAVRPLYVVSKIFGLAPYILTQKKDFEESRSVCICLSRMWSFSLVIVLITWGYISVDFHNDESLTMKRRIVEVAFIMSLYCCGTIHLILSLTINRHKVLQIIEKLSESDNLLSSMKYGHQIYKNTRLYLIIQFIVCISVLSLIISYDTYVIHSDINLLNYYRVFLESLPVYINSIMILQFVDFVLLLRNKYKFLNSELESISLASYKITTVQRCSNIHVTSIEDLRRKIASSRRQWFRNLRIIYSQLHDVALLINSTYGYSLIPAVLWIFIGVTSGASYVLDLNNTDFYRFIFVIVLWSAYCIGLTAAMALSCSQAVCECNRSPVIVQKIILRDDADSESVKELEKMFTQLQAMKIAFTACGLFNVDSSLICGIIGVTLSYIFVIAQF